MRYFAALLTLVLLAASPAPSIVGLWQGTMDAPGIGKLPRVMSITKSHGQYRVVIHSIDESDVPIVTQNVAVEGANVVMEFAMNSDPWLDYHRVYRAHLSPDGKSLNGTWEGGEVKVSMAYQRTKRAVFNLLGPKHDTYVTVDRNVKDEVLDWGGLGRPVLLLAGAGVTARGFRDIVPDLTAHYHVYSMIRRGFGNSSKPAYTVANYSATRLGKDVLAVIAALHLQKPILIGHSLAGEELSYIGDDEPEKVTALIYLDAGYSYAFNFGLATPAPHGPRPGAPSDPLQDAIFGGMEQFAPPTGLPVLAIYAHPHRQIPGAPRDSSFEDYAAKQIAALQRKSPSAQVVTIPGADHFVYMSNKAEVLRDINAFIATLPK